MKAQLLMTYRGIPLQGPVCILPHQVQVGAGAEEVHGILKEVRPGEVLQLSICHADPHLQQQDKQDENMTDMMHLLGSMTGRFYCSCPYLQCC